MSYCHIRVRKREETPGVVRYLVESPDFDEGRNWAAIAEIEINKLEKTYEFFPGNVWIQNRILPPDFYSLADDVRQKEYELKWKGQELGSGAYAMAVHHYASKFLEDENCPDEYPPCFFVS